MVFGYIRRERQIGEWYRPGAKDFALIADGHVVVLGALRGVVHAGAHGDDSATVVASSLLPTQIRIASYITRPPDGQPLPETFCPEVAYLRDGEVVIEKYVISK